MRAKAIRFSIVLIGAFATWFVLAVSFDPFFVVGGTHPATVWGPTIGWWTVAVSSAAFLGLAAFAVGRSLLAALCLCVWLFVLATATHRLVERSDGRVADVWMGFSLQALAEKGALDSELPRCNVGRWLAICAGAEGEELVTVTPVPFKRLHPGLLTQVEP